MAQQGGLGVSLGGSPVQHDVQLFTVSLRAESKIFFLDLKQNARGKYVKISEKGHNRERSTIVVPPAGVAWFLALLEYFIAPPPAEEQATNKQLRVEAKVFFFEPGENSRGRYLRISESCPGTRGNSSIIVPSGGASCSAWVGLHDALQRMSLAHLSPPSNLEMGAQLPADLEEQPQGGVLPEAQRTGSPTKLDVAGPGQLVGPGPSAPSIGRTKDGIQVLRVGHKRFFFDLGTNQKGDFLRITETVGAERMSIIVPAIALEEFSSALQECIAQQRAQAIE